MQDDLFGDAADPPKPTTQPARQAARARSVHPAPPDTDALSLAARLPPLIHLGSSTWTYPGWAGFVWAERYSESQLSKHGLPAYSQHPLLRAVGIDRGFYRPLTASEFERLAQQVPEDFRFTVKGPSFVTDALVRDERGQGQSLNPSFLDGELARREFVEPAIEGLGAKLGALVFQISPLPPQLRRRMSEQLQRLDALLAALPALPHGVVAIEVRDPEWLTPEFATVLKARGARYCLSLHPKLPPIEAQLPLLRALWPGPLVCRWNLHRKHGAFGYEDAVARYGEFERMQDPDPETRQALARVIRATSEAGYRSYVTVNNKAEGSAPMSVRELARAVLA